MASLQVRPVGRTVKWQLKPAHYWRSCGSSEPASSRVGTTVRLRSMVRMGGTHHGTQSHGHRSSCTAGPIAKGDAMGQTRKLYRSRTNRKLAGVCGGLAEYFNTDATLIRVLFVVLTVIGGAGPLIYLAMWIIVPEES